MVTAARNGTANEGPLQLWDLASQHATVLARNFWIRPSIVFSPDSKLLAFATFNHGVRLWSLSPLQEITNLLSDFSLTGPQGLAFSPDGQTLAYTWNQAGEIGLWDLRSQCEKPPLAGHRALVRTVVYTPDGQTLASCSVDGTIKLWDVTGQRAPVTFTNNLGAIAGMRISPDGTMLATAAVLGGQRITLRDTATGAPIRELNGHKNIVTDVAFAPDGRNLITGSAAGSVRVWDVTARHQEIERRRFTDSLGVFGGGTAFALSLSDNGQHLLTVYADKTFSIWDTITLTESQRRPLPVDEFSSAALAKGGKLAVFISRNGKALLWHTDTNKIERFITPVLNATRAAFSPDGESVAVGGDKVWVCDVATKTKVHTLSTLNDSPMKPTIFSLRFWPDSRKVAAGFHDGTVKIWDLSESKSEVTLSGHSEHVNALGLLPDGQTLVSMSDEILLRDLSSTGKTFSINPRQTHFYGCSVSPDGWRLAVGAWGGLITIWDLASRQEVATLRGHENRVQALCFLADGNTLVSVGADELCLWRAPSFEQTDREALEK